MKVKNATGTGDRSCSCGTWLDHCRKQGGSTSTLCVVTTCYKAAEVGAHIKKVGDTIEYIVPFCKGHNGDSSVLEIPDSTALARASVAETCGKAKTILTSGSGYRGSWPTR